MTHPFDLRPRTLPRAPTTPGPVADAAAALPTRPARPADLVEAGRAGELAHRGPAEEAKDRLPVYRLPFPSAPAPAPGPVAPPQAANPMLAMLLADPMFAMQFAVDQSRRGALEELAQLASDQQATNARLAELRKLKTAVKQALSDDRIDSAELDMVERLSRELGVDLSPQLRALRVKLDEVTAEHSGRNVGHGGERYMDLSPTSAEEWAQARGKLVEDLKSAIEMHEDNVKAEASNRELALQRATQEYSSVMQLASNLSRSSYETAKAIIGNTRA
jgi:hypothetical protein